MLSWKCRTLKSDFKKEPIRKRTIKILSLCHEKSTIREPGYHWKTEKIAGGLWNFCKYTMVHNTNSCGAIRMNSTFNGNSCYTGKIN